MLGGGLREIDHTRSKGKARSRERWRFGQLINRRLSLRPAAAGTILENRAALIVGLIYWAGLLGHPYCGVGLDFAIFRCYGAKLCFSYHS